MEFQQEERSLFSRFKSFLGESKRVFRVTKKPSMPEFKSIVKVSLIGMAIIGAIGFIISIIWILIQPT